MNKYHGKPCKKCGSTLRYTSNSNCIACKKEYIRQYRKKYPEKCRTYDKISKERNAEKIRQYRRENRGKRRLASQKYYQEHREEIIEKKRLYYLNNPLKAKRKIHRRRARKNNTKSEKYDFKEICNHYGNKCLRCGKKKKLTIDHIIPLSKGGDDKQSNIQPLCLNCNSKKGLKKTDYRPDKGPQRWIQQKLF